ncbi:actin-binding protein-like protein [Patellaria atrata CBS 101060]|uniref:Coronin n=1 Tax=Patellaria atrata CBS 101060 TaxID=1346257 RepID=A0A9P4S6D4_9PEZI|nr:actin-binding protein-like protein [Patellaria atrata CBS 101060]
MAGRFVRASKYRHVFGRSTKKEQCYDNLRISKNAWDSNIIKANPEYISVNWEASGGGAFAVIPINERGRLPEQIPLFRGHTAAVLDTDWSPFDDSLIASGSDDGKVFIWKVPENFTLYTEEEDVTDVSPVSKLTGHTRKVGHVVFNPAAANVLASSSGDYTIKLWDVEAGTSRLSLKHNDIVQSLSWSANGSLMVTTSRDKKLRIWDVRQEKPVQETPGHPGAKNSRAVWMGEHDRIATTGFSRMSDRQLGLWDTRALREPIGGFQILDSISGVCMPFWDDGTQMLYLAGKGDGNIRYYEYENDKFEYLSEYKSADPQRGIAFLPKRGINLHENEVMRGFKTVNDAFIEPISFIVPRRAEVFQSDIYPPTVGKNPAMSAAEFFDGAEAQLPPKINLESVYDGGEAEEVPANYHAHTSSAAEAKPAASAASPVLQKKEEKPPKSAQAASVPRSQDIKDNKASMESAASKFADNDDEDDEDETSGFEDVSRKSVAEHMEMKTSGPHISKSPEFIPRLAKSPKQESAPKLDPIDTPDPATSSTIDPPVQREQQEQEPRARATSTAGAAETLKSTLGDIKSLLEEQNRQLASQGDVIEGLRREVGELRARLEERD